jgi:hypothetical protein
MLAAQSFGRRPELTEISSQYICPLLPAHSSAKPGFRLPSENHLYKVQRTCVHRSRVVKIVDKMKPPRSSASESFSQALHMYDLPNSAAVWYMINRTREAWFTECTGLILIPDVHMSGQVQAGSVYTVTTP